jgi:uncharacterized membrane protein YoaK (UPF0700 family)
MDLDVSSKHVAELRIRREETLLVAMLLALAGGYLEAYTWIVYGVFANAQTANLVFLWIHAMAGEWVRAFHYVLPLMAFVLGVVTASWLRHFAGASAGRISILVETAFLFLVGILHNRFPAVAGTLGISVVAAMQTASFPRVEEWTYGSVMATSNLRQVIEGLFAAVAGRSGLRPFRQRRVFAVICAAFGVGAATRAYITEQVPAWALAIPVLLLLIALLRSVERGRDPRASSQSPV